MGDKNSSAEELDDKILELQDPELIDLPLQINKHPKESSEVVEN